MLNNNVLNDPYARIFITWIQITHEAEYRKIPSDRMILRFLERIKDSGYIGISRTGKVQILPAFVNDLLPSLDHIDPKTWQVNCVKTVKTCWGARLKSVLGINQYRSFLLRISISKEKNESDKLILEAIEDWKRPLTRSQLICSEKVYGIFCQAVDFVQLHTIMKPNGSQPCIYNPNLWSHDQWFSQYAIDKLANPKYLSQDAESILKYSGGFGPGVVAEKHETSLELEKLILAMNSLNNKTRPSSKPTAVPKNWKTERIIAPEPALHSYYQHRFDNWLRRIIEFCTPIRFSNQELSRARCRLDFATTDSSKASDSVKVGHVKVFLRDFSKSLLVLRTGHVIWKDKRIPIETFATMGSPNTFTVETIIFWMIAVAATFAAGIKLKLSDSQLYDAIMDVITYGDDILTRVFAFETVRIFLRGCGFLPNEGKSYGRPTDGYRETCGAETYNNVDVAPVRIPRGWHTDCFKTEDPATIADFCNSIADKGYLYTVDSFVRWFNGLEERCHRDVQLGTTTDDSVLLVKSLYSFKTQFLGSFRKKDTSERHRIYSDIARELGQAEIDPLVVYSPLSGDTPTSHRMKATDKLDRYIAKRNRMARYIDPYLSVSPFLMFGCTSMLTLRQRKGKVKKSIEIFTDRVDLLGHVHFSESEWDSFARDYVLAKQTWYHLLLDRMYNPPEDPNGFYGDRSFHLAAVDNLLSLPSLRYGNPEVFYSKKLKK